jgi:hypothetical protein
LIYLDPHYIQPKFSCNTEEYETNPSTFHFKDARLINMDNLDPSLSFGYLINTYDDYIELTESINKLNENIFDD